MGTESESVVYIAYSFTVINGCYSQMGEVHIICELESNANEL